MVDCVETEQTGALPWYIEILRHWTYSFCKTTREMRKQLFKRNTPWSSILV